MRFLIMVLPLLAACAASPAPAEPGYDESLLPGSIGVLAERKAQGIVVTGVSRAAAQAGLREGDLILRYNGVAVQELRAFNRLVLDSKPRSTARVEFLRGDAVHVLHVPVRQLDTMPRA